MGWTKNESVLRNISFKFKPGDKVAIVGKVGSGKSSLLLAVLGELPVSAGTIRSNNEFAYAEQTPLIVAGTLRSNILFGSTYK